MAEATKRLVFLGATPFPEIVEIVRDINRIQPTYQITAILDDNPSLHGTAIEGVTVLGPLAMCHDYPNVEFVFGIGSHRLRLVRHDILRRLGLPRERYATLIHPSAKIYSTARVGQGCIIFPGAVIFCDSVIEDFVQVLANTVVGPENYICEGALLTSLVSLTSKVIVGHYSHVGMFSAIGPGVRIGAGAQIAMGSVVLRDVPPGVFQMGMPPKILRRETVAPEIMERWNRIVQVKQ